MKRGLFLTLLGALASTPLQAYDYPPGLSEHHGLFAPAKEVFRPLMADPRELQIALRLVTPVSQSNLGEVNIGDYFGLYRWKLPFEDSYFQWSVGGGIFSRFDLVATEKDLQYIDFSANMPIDLRVKKWSFRVMPYHVSSHMGDDLIKRTGVLPQKYTADSFKTLVSYEPWRSLRLYGGFNFIIRNGERHLGHYAVQTGAEWTSPWYIDNHVQLFWATDFQSWERVEWNPTVNTQVGVRMANHPNDSHMLSLYTEYGAGHMAFGQVFQQKESHWVLGLRFEVI